MRMVGSMDRYFTRASAWPSAREGSGASASCRSPGASKPVGRACNRSWRLVLTIFAFGSCSVEVLRLPSSGSLRMTLSWFRPLSSSSEGDVFVGDFWAGAGGAGLFVAGAGTGVEVVAAAAAARSASTGTGSRAGRGAFRASAEHAEIAGHDFKAGALLAFLVLPLAGLDASLDEDQRAFLQILLGDFGLFAPDDDFVPLGALLALAVAVFVGFIGGHGKIADGLAPTGVARLWIAAQAADENDFINGHTFPLRSSSCAKRDPSSLRSVGMTILVGSSLYSQTFRSLLAGRTIACRR